MVTSLDKTALFPMWPVVSEHFGQHGSDHLPNGQVHLATSIRFIVTFASEDLSRPVLTYDEDEQ